MTVTMPERLAFRGGAVKGHLIAPVAPTDLIVSCDALTDWPTGSDGRFQAVIGRGLVNEEKVLVAIRSGGVLTIAQRGWDGTQAVSHAATETVEHVHTAHDADEANSHGSKVYGHGVASDDAIVGVRKSATLRNKTIDGTLNTLQNIPEGASPETADHVQAVEDALAAEVTARANGDTARYTKTEADARFEPIDSAYTKAEADALFLDATEADALFLTPAEGDTRYSPVRNDSGWLTSTTGFVAQSGWSLTSVRHRTVVEGSLTLIDLYVAMTRTGAPIAPTADGDIGNTPMVIVPVGLRPSGVTPMPGPGSTSGRLLGAALSTTGTLYLCAIGGTSNFRTGEVATVRGFFIQ